MAPKDQKLELLARVPLFGGLRGRDLQEIGMLADEVDVPAGQVLMRQGDRAGEFFIVVDGSLVVEQDGRRIATLGPGDFAGEIGLVDEGPRTATVTTDTPARLLVVGHQAFHTLLDTHPAIQIEVLQALARRVRNLEPEGVH